MSPEKLRELVAAELVRIERPDANVDHVVAWMRVEPTASRLQGGAALTESVLFALYCVEARTFEENEALREAVEDREQRRATRQS